MDATSLLLFTVALCLAAGAPGPSVAALVAKILARGWREAAPFLVAMWVGELLWLALALAGLSALAESFQGVFTVIKYCGVVYLLYLAWKMWTAPAVVPSDGAPAGFGSPIRTFMAGMAVTLGNPKIMVFYVALLPTLIDINSVVVMDWVVLLSVTFIVLAVIDSSYMALAARARLLLKSPKTVKFANRFSATAMATAATVIASRN